RESTNSPSARFLFTEQNRAHSITQNERRECAPIPLERNGEGILLEGEKTSEAPRRLARLRVPRGRRPGGGIIYKVLQFFAGLEVGNLLRRYFDFFSSLGIPAHAPPAFPRAKAAEPANLDLFALLQSRDDVVENSFDNCFRFFARKLSNVQDFLDQVRLRECRRRMLAHLRFAS